MDNMLFLKDYTLNNFHIADLCIDKRIIAKEHCHDFYEIFIVVSGEFVERVNGIEHTYQKGSVRLVSPDTYHSIYSSGSCSDNHLKNIAISKSQISKEFSELFNLSNNFFIEPDKLSEISFKMEKASKMSDDMAIKEILLKNVTEDILLNIFLQVRQGITAPLWLKKLHSEMTKEENFLLGTEQFVKLAGVSHSHLCREFQKYYSMTPVEYINIQKIVMAGRLLRQTDSKIIDIASDSGFDNISYFNRMFSKFYNITPSQYRRKNRGVF